ncbi:aspartyl protease family protein [Tenacibaculum sp. 1_MG-2023]|uniref:retropepsin-like aspartic protease n=1 Tax=Tenacibaculum sp. 1_MG-2023 TaxID=3062653 RepID=UPI0026E2D1B5|nr:aspartyl protease family protein [Tenacibaculum sp. 1_MG-2023]MDO6676678.1 aspartyl protease family protein [Tenacibaculum sp. 1_MG-2023]
MNRLLLYFFTLHLSVSAFTQQGFQFLGNGTKKQSIRFQLINNLVVIPLEINGHQLSFILDTGVNRTILFNLTSKDSIGLNNVKKVFIRGLGSGEPVEALFSRGNNFRIKNITSSNQGLYVILKDAFDISAKMGTTIHGIIGYDLLKDVIVKINYVNKRIDFYNPKTYGLNVCNKCESFPLQFYRNKPYIDVNVQVDTLGTRMLPVKLLIDTGGSDAVWLFEGTKKELKTPKKFFKDIIGEGFSGTIYGNRSRIQKISIGKFKIGEPTVSFLDSSSTFNARQFKERNGSIGGGILKRFKVWIDYPNKRVVLKKNASLNKGFYYNMSGLHIVYDGQELIKEKGTTKFTDSYSTNNQTAKNNVISLVSTFFYRFKPKYKIDKVVENSPAFKAGLQVEDVIKRINGKAAHEYHLNEIIDMFHTKPNKKIRMEVERNGVKLKFMFRLEQRI